VVVDARGYQPETLAVHERIADGVANPLSSVWRRNQPLFVASKDDAHQKYPELSEIFDRSPFQAWAIMPLGIEKHILGVLALSFAEPRPLDADERGFLLALAEVAGQAVDRARLFVSEQAARAEAEGAVRAQDEFLSVAAHELRTPVSAVKATAQLAERGISRGQIDAERLTRHLQRIARSADRLGALIEDLLDVSRLRTGRLQLRRESVELTPLVQEIVGRYAATQHVHELVFDPPPDVIRVDADPLRLEQVLDNLLSNAVKYSPNGGRIEVRLERDGAGAMLSVTDSGIGLPAGQESRIFEAFGRGSNATARQIQGLGLGLAICRQLVELHGGSIWASSPGEGQGTTVSMWVPTIDV
jgi:signal transduction histidine kinase